MKTGPMHSLLAIPLLLASLIWLSVSANAQVDPATLEKGRRLYLQHCFACHQMNGQGLKGTFPPLAKSDYLAADLDRSIRILCEGLNGAVTVNGVKYDSMMPAVVINDEDAASVLTYVHNAWGNTNGIVSAAQVSAVRAKTGFPTFQALSDAASFRPLPKPPEGFKLREVARLPVNGTRLASDGKGAHLYVMSGAGDVHRVDIATGKIRPVYKAVDYAVRRTNDIWPPVISTAMTMDKEGRLYTVLNQQSAATKPVQNHVMVYRTSGTSAEGDPINAHLWFETNYHGNPAYIHAAENLAFGPDGFLYMGNGARTDSNEANGDPNYYQGGEVHLTASMWRIDPKTEPPTMEIYARGLRNPYGFAWNDKGEMFVTENGPDAHAPEELNMIERGNHYGFPYQFADWTEKAYKHTPDAPPGLVFTRPIANLGPDGGFDGKPMFTFHPHSCPGGMVWLGNDFPENYRGTLMLVRFGNFIRDKGDSGFDVLQARLKKNAAGVYEANIHTVLAPLGRPIDIHQSGAGKLYILEYTRPTSPAFSFSMPGRIIELSVAK